MGGCCSVADKEQLARDLDRIAALEASECELRLQTDDSDLPVSCVRAYRRMRGASTLEAQSAVQYQRIAIKLYESNLS